MQQQQAILVGEEGLDSSEIESGRSTEIGNRHSRLCGGFLNHLQFVPPDPNRNGSTLIALSGHDRSHKFRLVRSL